MQYTHRNYRLYFLTYDSSWAILSVHVINFKYIRVHTHVFSPFLRNTVYVVKKKIRKVIGGKLLLLSYMLGGLIDFKSHFDWSLFCLAKDLKLGSLKKEFVCAIYDYISESIRSIRVLRFRKKRINFLIISWSRIFYSFLIFLKYYLQCITIRNAPWISFFPLAFISNE